MNTERAVTVLVTGGTGYVGRHVVRALLDRGVPCVVVSRGDRNPWKDERVRMVRANPATPGTWQQEVSRANAIVNLAGARIVDPPQRWTAARKREIHRSRVDTTQLLAEAIVSAPTAPETFVSASAVGFYGSRGDVRLDEAAEPGDDFLAQLCVEWEHAASAVQDPTRVVLLRTAPVLGKSSPVLGPMLPAFKLGVGGPWGPGTQWWPWIHVADVVGIIMAALDGTLRGPVNLAAPSPVRVQEFAAALGRALNRPAVARVPAFVLRVALGEAAEALLASQRVVPRRALDAGYVFRFPDLASALADIFNA